ncbi:hypothetical protein M8C21_021799 [Ambrosia artemisiifolia]|uniref:DUF7798 domain-containing protein n=1 Tax=Ambrosia artemisiifolia TaxID=4212 RepID=A0AAD5G2C2_AMBAR|nr:hypothetical protein M8C21_021799 [Ambrosia artemisiifolia]
MPWPPLKPPKQKYSSGFTPISLFLSLSLSLSHTHTHIMKLLNIPNRRTLTHQPIITTTQPQHTLFSSLPFQETKHPVTTPTNPPQITPQTLQNHIFSSQWHFVEQVADTLTPTTISTTLYNCRTYPTQVLNFTQYFTPTNTNLESFCLSITIISNLPSHKPCLNYNDLFDGLVNARKRLGVTNTMVDEVVKCFYSMKQKKLLPRIETCNEGKLKKAKEFVGNMEAVGLMPDVDVDGARRVFERMKGKGIRPDEYSYGALVSGLCKVGRFKEASELLCKMEEVGLVPTAVTYNTLIDGYCNKGNLEMAFRYKDEMVKKGICPSVSTYNSLIHALVFEGKESEGEDMIEEMEKEGLVPDAITLGNARKAFSFHDEMISKGIQPTHVTYTSLINVLNKRNRMTEADNLFAKIIERGVVPDVVMFNALIDGHCANKNIKRALLLLKEMDRLKIFPDEVTYNTLMQGYCREGDVEEAIKVFDEMKKRGIKPDFISFNTLISGYSRRGDMKEALMVRDAMLSSGFNPTLLTYNALIQGLCKNKEGHVAHELYKEMVSKGISPDDSTLYSLIDGIQNVDEIMESLNTEFKIEDDVTSVLSMVTATHNIDLQELDALSNHYALLFNPRKAKLSTEERFAYDVKLKGAQTI